jgi:AraC family transcriptional regulator of arabinose operon
MDQQITAITELNKIKEGFAGQVSCILPKSKRKFCSANTVCKKMYITDIGYYPNASFHSRERKQGCQQFILIYCVKGKGWYKVKNKKFAVAPNHYFVLPKGIAHEYGADPADPWSIYWVHFTGEMADAFASILQPTQHGPLPTNPSALRLMLFEDLISHLELFNDNANLIYANSSFYAFLISFQRVRHKNPGKEDSPVEKIILYMKENLDKNLSVDDLAKHVHMSASRLAAVFKQKTKLTPISLFTSLKIQKASQLLLDKNYSIKMVAASIGYDDPYHFSKVFKNIMGLSPKFFKQQL